MGQNAPTVLRSLNPGASEAALQGLEEITGMNLPAAVRESYSIHNGQAINPASGGSPGFLYGWSLFSLDRIAEEWKVWQVAVPRPSSPKAKRPGG